MADTDIMQEIAEARIDMQSFASFMYKPADFIVTRRLAPPVHSFNWFLASIKSAIQNTGFTIKGSFSSGAVLSELNDVIKDNDGSIYRWDGNLPKTVIAGAVPSTDGFGVGKWQLMQQANAKPIDVKNTTLLSKLQVVLDTGNYIVTNAPDTPFDGIATALIYLKNGEYTGTCEILELGADYNRRAIATMKNSIWSEFNELPSYKGRLTPVSNSKKFILADGGYSWWSEPQSIQVSGIHPKMITGAVSTESGWTKSLSVDNTTEVPTTKTSYLKSGTEYVADEHNAPITIVAKDRLVTFIAGHDDVNYLPYRVSSDLNVDNYGAEKKIQSPSGAVSYAQAFYSAELDLLYVAFRSGGANGAGRSWYIAQSSNWDTGMPNWVVNQVFTDTDQLYLRIAPDTNDGLIRCVLTKNARYTGNGLWYAYINLRNNIISTANGVAVGELGTGVISLSSLAKVYSSTRLIRLYDVRSDRTRLPILVSEFDDELSGVYKYLEFDLPTQSIKRDVDIVASGKSLGSNYYFGGAHFSNNTGLNDEPATPMGFIYIAREEMGIWYLEEWETVNNAGGTWVKVRVIDSSREKIWRPRVPFNTQKNNYPNQIRLTWCKGIWHNFGNYKSKIWALID